MKKIAIKIFLATASDAKDLLEIAKKEIENIKNAYIGLDIKVYDWNTTAVPAMGIPEKVILEQMPIESADIFIEIFRFKYGEKTNIINPITKELYQSGMEQEFFTAYMSWKERKCPEIIVFKSEEPIPREIALQYEQIQLTEKFFKEFGAFGKHPGLYNTYKSQEEFTVKFRKSLLAKIFGIMEKELPEDYIRFKEHKESGLKDIFFDIDNDERNKVKREQILNTKTLRLQARSCFSFISRGALLNSYVHKSLRKGMKFQIIMQNPWSLNALYAGLNEKDFDSKVKYKQYLQHTLPAVEIIHVYEKSYWKKVRFQASLEGFKDLRKEYGRQIELKVSDTDLSNSIFLSDEYLFIEPYVNTHIADKKALALFETQISNDSDLYRQMSSYFEIQWKSSYSYSYFNENEMKFKKRLENYLENSIKEKK